MSAATYATLQFCLLSGERPRVIVEEHPTTADIMVTIGHGVSSFTISGDQTTIREFARKLNEACVRLVTREDREHVALDALRVAAIEELAERDECQREDADEARAEMARDR